MKTGKEKEPAESVRRLVIRSGHELIFHAIAGAFDDNGFGMVQKPIQQSGSQAVVVIEHGGPLLEGFVRRQDQRTVLVSLADHLEQQIGAGFVNRQVADFIEDQQVGREIFLELHFQSTDGLGGQQAVDPINGGGKQYGAAFAMDSVKDVGGDG